METAFFKFSVEEKDSHKVFSTSIVSIFSTTILFILVCILYSTPIGNYLGYSNHTEYVKWFALIIGFDALSAIPLAKLRALNRAGYFMWVNLANVGVNIALNFFFLVYCKHVYDSSNTGTNWIINTCYNPEIGVGYVFISNLIASTVKLLLLSPVFFRTRFYPDLKLLRKMLIYAIPLLLGGLAGIINETADRVMLKHLLPLSEKETLTQLGIYGACYKISILMTLFIQAFRFAAEPFFFSKQKESGAKRLYATVMNYFVAICSILFLGIMLYIDVVMRLIGEEFRTGIGIVPVLLMANLFLGIVFNFSIWYKLTGKTIYGAYLALFGASITIVLNYIWIPQIGYVGSAYATLICYASIAVLSYILSRKHFAVDYNLLKIVTYPFSAFILYYFSNNFIAMDGSLKYFLNSLLFIAFVIGVVLIEKPTKFAVLNKNN